MAFGSDDYYKILGLNRNASSSEIKKAFHRLAFEYHPDRNPVNENSADLFRGINEAYRVLISPESRKRYDEQNVFVYRSYQGNIQPYLTAEVDETTVKLNEEIELTFAFVGEGRFFKKPAFNGFIVTSGPLVSYRNSAINNDVRETLLSYTVCPLITGTLVIPAASISFGKLKYQSNEITVYVSENKCYFRKGEPAGDYPLQIKLIREKVTSNTIYKKIIRSQHIILIPRSNLAAFYHRVGKVMKIVFSVCGIAWALVKGESIILGFLAGSFLAGINCQIMYKVMGIKSVFYNVRKYSAVAEYYNDKIKGGKEEEIIDNRKWEFFKSLFM